MNNPLFRIAVGPGSMGVAGLALDLFGIERVDPGTWATPVYANRLTTEEVAFAKEFFEGEYGLTVTVLEKE